MVCFCRCRVKDLRFTITHTLETGSEVYYWSLYSHWWSRSADTETLLYLHSTCICCNPSDSPLPLLPLFSLLCLLFFVRLSPHLSSTEWQPTPPLALPVRPANLDLSLPVGSLVSFSPPKSVQFSILQVHYVTEAAISVCHLFQVCLLNEVHIFSYLNSWYYTVIH